MNNLKYTHYDIVFQEVPNEITLVFNISGCPYRCKGCHSQYLWDYIGDDVIQDIDAVIRKYEGLITCVCFMGGDQNIVELKELLMIVKDTYKLKTCIYSGNDNLNTFSDLLGYIDYLKIGRYIEEVGGLGRESTNQRFYGVSHNGNNNFTDLTKLFIIQNKGEF